jgi:hypothetical protein
MTVDTAARLRSRGRSYPMTPPLLLRVLLDLYPIRVWLCVLLLRVAMMGDVLGYLLSVFPQLVLDD